MQGYIINIQILIREKSIYNIKLNEYYIIKLNEYYKIKNIVNTHIMTQLISYESSSFNKNENLLFNIIYYAIVLLYNCYIFILKIKNNIILEKEKYNKKLIDLKQNIIIEKEKREKLENELSELTKVLQHFILENKLEKKKNDLKIVNFKEILQYQLTELTEQFISEKEKNEFKFIEFKEKLEQELAEVIHQFILEKEITKTELINFKEKLEQQLTQQFISEKEIITFKINDFKKNIKRTLTELTQQFILEKEITKTELINFKEKLEQQLTQQFISEKEINKTDLINFKDGLQHQLTKLTEQFISEKEKNNISEKENIILIGYKSKSTTEFKNSYIPIYFDKNIHCDELHNNIMHDSRVGCGDISLLADIIINIETLYKMPNMRNFDLYNLISRFVPGHNDIIFKYHGNIILSSRNFNSDRPLLVANNSFSGGGYIDKKYKRQILNMFDMHPDLFYKHEVYHLQMTNYEERDSKDF